MDFVKRHLFFILCGVGALAGVALGVTGLRAMPKVRAELEAAAGVYKNLEIAAGQAVNQKSIEAENERIKSIQDDNRAVVEQATKLYHHKPLIDGVFPSGPPEKRVEFRNKYHEAMRALLDSLRWGSPPIATDVEAMRDKIENEKAAEKQFGADPSAGPLRTPAEVLTKAGAKLDPVPRAALAAAQRIYCYAVNLLDEKPPERVASLEFPAAMKDLSSLDAPEIDACWRAQLTYWIQEDVVAAIAAMNNQAAEEALAAKGSAWIGVMPVKDVISIRLSDYVPAKGALYVPAQPGGYNLATVPGTAESVFTGTCPTAAYDVLQFTVKLVMDQRDIPLLVERICNDSFYTLVRASYKAVPPNKTMTGKIYGAEPAVNVVLDFEAVMLGEVFRVWMPDPVCEKNDIQCPSRDKAAGEKDEG